MEHEIFASSMTVLLESATCAQSLSQKPLLNLLLLYISTDGSTELFHGMPCFVVTNILHSPAFIPWLL